MNDKCMLRSSNSVIAARTFGLFREQTFYILSFLFLILITQSSYAQDTSCSDIANWIDAYGDGCDWYASKPNACDAYGECCERYGYTASTACCICGGGEIVNINPAGAPTLPPKNEGDDCVDEEGWEDEFGDGCGWYSQYDPTCEYGWSAEGSNGLYPNEACCICGGGTLFVPSPSGVPSVVTSTEPSGKILLFWMMLL